MLIAGKANGVGMSRHRNRCLQVLVFSVGFSLAVCRAEPVEKFPSIMETEDVIDWVLKWTGAELYPSQFGPAGWPGKDPELFGEYGYRGNNWGWPEVIPYPNTAEHVRVHRQRYMPMYAVHNARTLNKKFRATKLPGIEEDRIVEYAEPVYRVPKYRYPNPEAGIFSDAIKLGKYRKPVKAVRFDQHHPPIVLDLGTLKPSAYVVRMIAATESEKVQQSTKRLVIHFEINDGPKGEVNAYRKRCAATDQFYSMAEFFFMASDDRQFRIKLRVDASSELPLYVYYIDLHDRLAQVANRAGKQSPSFYDEKERAAKWTDAGGPKKDPRSKKERFEADANQLSNLPRMNAQSRGGTRFWSQVTGALYRMPQDKVDDGMGIDVYGSDMIWNVPEKEYAGHRYEWVFRRASLAGRYWHLQRQTYYGKAAEISLKLRRIRIRSHRRLPRRIENYVKTGDEALARTAAIRLAMVAWLNIFNVDGFRQTMCSIDTVPELGWNQGDLAFRRRGAIHYGGRFGDVKEYDALFPYIRGNEELAESLGRFIPWIKTAEDMVRFYEVGLLQIPAHETMIYQRYNDYSAGAWMSWYIAAQQDKEITKPWLEWIFRYVWTYPRMPAGIDETMFVSWTRDGTTTIGSTFYALGSVGNLRDILRNLSPLAKDPARSMPGDVRIPEVVSRAEWEGKFAQDTLVAGGYRFWVGDVSGPSRPRWVATGRADFDKKIDPKNKSRVLSNWFGVLETGQEQEDFRNRRAAGLRVGNGMGHSHNDPLDLQIWALGVPLSGDWGCRGGYCYPGTKALLSHNTVVASDLLKDSRHRWISSFCDAEGSRYLMGRADCPGFYGRQIALVDVDEPVPNSYVVDIFRVKGGNEKPYYAFHGPPPDDFYTNIEEVKKGYPDGNEGPLFDPEHNWHGEIPDHLTASWRMGRDEAKLEWTPSPKMQKSLTWFGLPGEEGGKQKLKVPGAERKAMGDAFDPSEPRKQIRLHLVGHEGAVAFGRRGYGVRAEKFYNEMLFVYPARWKGQTVFPVVFEPNPDERVIRNVKLLSDQDSVNDSSSSVALEITLRKGRKDVIYTAMRDSEPFKVAGHGTIHGEYAFLSYDDKGLRQATLVGGSLLDAKDIRIKTARAAYEGKVVAGIASEKTLILSDALPKEAENAVIEIGPEMRPTSYTIKSVDGKRVVMHKDFALTMSRIRGFLKEDGSPFTNCKISTPPGVPVSNEKGDKWWRSGEHYKLKTEELAWWCGGTAHPAEIPPRGKALRLVEGADPPQALRVGERLWVHEVGVGSSYRLPAFVNVIRRKDGSFDVRGNVEAEVTAAGKQLAIPKK